MRQRRCASTAPAVATATAKECGCTVLIRLVRSITPSTRPVSGSCTGAAAQVHACTTSLKCSAANTWTAWSAASAVPIAFVPAPLSLHSAPTAKFIEFAAESRTPGAPSSHSSVPSASLTTIRCAASSAMPAKHSRISGATVTSGWTSQRAAASSSSATDGAEPLGPGSTPAANERRHESAIGPRTDSGRPPPRKRSQARRTSRARSAGEVVASIASQGLRNRLPLVRGPGSGQGHGIAAPSGRQPLQRSCSASPLQTLVRAAAPSGAAARRHGGARRRGWTVRRPKAARRPARPGDRAGRAAGAELPRAAPRRRARRRGRAGRGQERVDRLLPAREPRRGGLRRARGRALRAQHEVAPAAPRRQAIATRSRTPSTTSSCAPTSAATSASCAAA